MSLHYPEFEYDSRQTVRQNVAANLLRTRLNRPEIIDEVAATIEGFLKEDRFVHVDDYTEIDVAWYKANPEHKKSGLYLLWNTAFVHKLPDPDEVAEAVQRLGGAETMSDEDVDKLFQYSVYRLLPVSLRRELIGDAETYMSFWRKGIVILNVLRQLVNAMIIHSLAKI